LSYDSLVSLIKLAGKKWENSKFLGVAFWVEHHVFMRVRGACFERGKFRVSKFFVKMIS